MSMFRRMVGPWLLLVVAAVAWGGWPQSSPAEDTAPAGQDAAATSPAAEDPFAVPDGDAATLLKYINGLADPQDPIDDLDKYRDRASTAILAAADKVLSGEATDQQAVDAVQWKVEALRIRAAVGDPDAAERRDAFLNKMLKDPRPEVAGMVAVMRLVPKLPLERWFRLDDAQRAKAVDQFVADVKAAGPTVNQTVLLAQFCDLLADTSDGGLALRAIRELSPTLAKSTDPDIQRIASELEGMARRIDLPGNKLEIEGTLMDGTKLDWESYHGKVVLVDFWASWCGPCRREVPNILANYRAYHDKGFEVVGVCLDDKRGDAEQYIEEAGVVWPSVFSDKPNERGWRNPVAKKYAVSGVPRAILVDRDGRVVDFVNQNGIQLGLMARGPLLGAQLKELLGEPVSAAGTEDDAAGSSAAQPADGNSAVSDDVPATP